MDATDRQLAELMIGQMEANLAYLRAEGDADYADIMYCLDRIAYYRRRLHDATFGMIVGCSR